MSRKFPNVVEDSLRDYAEIYGIPVHETLETTVRREEIFELWFLVSQNWVTVVNHPTGIYGDEQIDLQTFSFNLV